MKLDKVEATYRIRLGAKTMSRIQKCEAVTAYPLTLKYDLYSVDGVGEVSFQSTSIKVNLEGDYDHEQTHAEIIARIERYLA